MDTDKKSNVVSEGVASIPAKQEPAAVETGKATTPAKAPEDAELDDADLEKVAGGPKYAF